MSRARIHMVGNAHLDPAWMWSWDEGMEAFLSTVRSALDRIDETPGFVFTCSSAAHYRWIEEVEPDLFDRVRTAIASGRWAVVGGWWVQADCNLPSGEGFVRQALLGQRWFLSRFGRRARTGYSPDAFGHTLGLPQLLARAGMDAYIYCRPDPTELTLPSPLLDWRSPDGASVLAYRVPFHYNMYESSVPKKVDGLVEALDGASALAAGDAPLGRFGSAWSLFYGVGNHGGGPTREHIEQIIAIDADEHGPRLLFSSPDHFFDDVRAGRATREIPVWRDDLQIDAPGCYSAHSLIKRLNRRSEHALVEAERMSALAALLVDAPYPHAELTRAWEHVCFNHFHDILCGVATREALDDAIAEYGAALTAAGRATRYAVQRIARAIDTSGDAQALVVINSHAWRVDGVVRFELWHDIDKSLWTQPVDVRVTDEDGREIPSQLGFTTGKIGRDRIGVTLPAALPALGWRTLRVHYGEPCTLGSAYPGEATGAVLDNGVVRVEIDSDTGAIASLRMVADGEEIVRGGGTGLVVDDPTDTWGHGVESFDAVIGTFDGASVRLVESGPVYATIRSVARFGASTLQQDYRLDAGSGVVDVDVKVLWSEQHRMLKLAFPAARSGATSHAESAYAVTSKPSDGRERPCGTWCAVTSPDGHGVAIVTDAKHGYSCRQRTDGAELRLSVLRSPSYATHIPHPFDELEDLDHLDQGVQRFRYRIVPLFGGVDGAMLARLGAMLCSPPIAHLESAHAATKHALPRRYEGIRVEPESVLATVLKKAEDGDGWIVRLFESSGTACRADVDVPVIGARWSVEIGAFEVRTFRVSDGVVAEVDLVELE